MADRTLPTIEVGDNERKPNLIPYEKLTDEQVGMAKIVHDKAVEMGIDPDLALSISWQESGFKPSSVSPRGAVGLMQVMPKTAELYKVDPEDLKDINTNVELGLRILKDNIAQHKGNQIAALVQYNAGSDVTADFLKSGYDPSKLPEETKRYIEDIYSNYPRLLGENESDQQKYVEAFSPVEFIEEAAPTATPESDLSKKAFKAIGENLPGIAAGVGTGATQYGANVLKDKSAQRLQARQPVVQAPVNIEEEFKLKGQDPNMQRILQGTTEEGLTGRQRQSYSDITSARATLAEQQEAALDDLVRKGLIPPDYKAKIFSSSMPTESTPSGVLYSGQRLSDEQKLAVEEAQRNQSPVQKVIDRMKYVGGLPRKAVNLPIAKSVRGLGRFGLSPLATGVSTAAMLAHIDEASQREREGDVLGAQISRFKAISEGVGSMPTTNPVFSGLKALSYPTSLGLNAYDAWRQNQSVVKKP